MSDTDAQTNIEIGALQGVGFAVAYIAVWFIAWKFLGVKHP